jgi:hypothetical protein
MGEISLFWLRLAFTSKTNKIDRSSPLSVRCYRKAIAGYLSYREIRLFDYARRAQPLRGEARTNAERLAAEAGLEIEFTRKL